MPVDPARAAGAYVRAQVYRARPPEPPLTTTPEGPADPGGPAGPALPGPAATEPAAPRPPGRVARLLLFLRQGSTPAPGLRRP
ncbi:hypothetical protein [Streptomyces sp. NPDC002537]